MSAIRHPCLIMGQCPSNFEGRNILASSLKILDFFREIFAARSTSCPLKSGNHCLWGSCYVAMGEIRARRTGYTRLHEKRTRKIKTILGIPDWGMMMGLYRKCPGVLLKISRIRAHPTEFPIVTILKMHPVHLCFPK
ncbi:MAG: hypothetical protein BECKG1743D_GA0114223_101642 [Candidatus Kentron sp. G]|nr:MAG: hypothetical protein BECKG1743D_GA0114223_101642 [Candidatus Kentron sp. G]